MKQLLHQPFKIFWSIIPIILLLSFLGINRTIDIAMHDTYFVIAVIHIGFFYALLFGLFGFLYWLVRKKQLIHWMTIGHVFPTLLTFVVIPLLNSLSRSVFIIDALNIFIFVLLFITTLGQILLLLNLMISLFRNRIK